VRVGLAAYCKSQEGHVIRVNAGTIKALCAMVFAGLGIIQFGAFMPDTHVGQVRVNFWDG
jgi:hypothetical protein